MRPGPKEPWPMTHVPCSVFLVPTLAPPPPSPSPHPRLELFPRVVRALKERGVDPDQILLFAGGIIPDEDIPALKELGFREVFRPGASTQAIIEYVRRWTAARRGG